MRLAKARLKETADEIGLILNTALDFMEKPKDDTHHRRFKIYFYEGVPTTNPRLPRKYGIGVVYEIDGVQYTVIKPDKRARDQNELDHYIDCLMSFACDISNGYTDRNISEFDEDFMQLVKIGRIKIFNPDRRSK